MTPEDYLALHNAVQELNMDCGVYGCLFRKHEDKGILHANVFCSCIEEMSAIERSQVKCVLRLAIKAFTCEPSTKENS